MLYPIIYQKEKYDCGPACIGMICAFYNKSVSVNEICHMANTDEKGTNIWNMQSTLKLLGFQTIAIKINDFVLVYDFLIPTIAVIRTFSDLNHYVVIYKKLKDNIIIGDPEKGLVEIKVSKFLNKFTGFLIIPKK